MKKKKQLQWGQKTLQYEDLMVYMKKLSDDIRLSIYPTKEEDKFLLDLTQTDRHYLSVLIHEGAGYKEVALTKAAYEGNLPLVKKILSVKVDIHVHNDAPFTLASAMGALNVVEYLVERGADIHVGNDEALVLAAQLGHVQVVDFLVAKGLDIHAQGDSGLIYAAYLFRSEMIQYLVEKGADPQIILNISNGYSGFEKELEQSKEWARQYIETRDFRNKLQEQLPEDNSSKASKPMKI
ncbi:ankyrin repeat domain-containing protein [Burkholderia contaminans]|uniref:ankyrin repeat domain-containing protein n=1 Tax=Burkholderia contaminans TaxID=488447 RepID=UPI00158C8466|nr:ankyrin repeat domain-containing protein [Burkholderia contaminans]